MILLAFPRYEQLATQLAALVSVGRAPFSVRRFQNGELHATLGTVEATQQYFLLGSTAPPHEDLLATLLVAHTVKREGARRLTALLPYLGYARQDRVEPGKSLAAAWIGALIHACGVDEVLTVDVHSRFVPQLFPITLRSLSPAPVFGMELAKLALEDLTVVAPDEGAVPRAEAVRSAAEIERPIAYFKKRRGREGIAHSTLNGVVSRRAVVVDDILDTGSTLVSACEGLRAAGTEEIVIMVTHGLFTGTGWQRLWSLGTTRIYCTDTVPLPQPAVAKDIVVLSVAHVLADHLTGIAG